MKRGRGGDQNSHDASHPKGVNEFCENFNGMALSCAPRIEARLSLDTTQELGVEHSLATSVQQ
jgi:hypothetical protein